MPARHPDPITFPLPLIRPLDYAAFALTRRLWRMGAAWANYGSRCNVRVIGAYFSGNLGDWSMAQVVARIGREMALRPGLFDYSSGSDRLHPVVMGGGELGDAVHFGQAIHQSPAPERISACGINPVFNFGDLPPVLLKKIARFAYVSARSKAGAEAMRVALNRGEIEYNPDIAFALYSEKGSPPPRLAAKPILAINLMTFYVSVQGKRYFAPDRSLVSVVADPRFASAIEQAGQQYVVCMRELVRAAASNGWEVVNIPFSPVDAMFAEAVLGDLPVNLLAYSRNPLTVVDVLRKCGKFAATRFHAHVFGLLARVPTVSIGYAGKCQYLWEDLELDSGQQISRLDVCSKPEECAERIWAMRGVTLPHATLERLSGEARGSVAKAYRAVAVGRQGE